MIAHFVAPQAHSSSAHASFLKWYCVLSCRATHRFCCSIHHHANGSYQRYGVPVQAGDHCPHKNFWIDLVLVHAKPGHSQKQIQQRQLAAPVAFTEKGGGEPRLFHRCDVPRGSQSCQDQACSASDLQPQVARRAFHSWINGLWITKRIPTFAVRIARRCPAQP